MQESFTYLNDEEFVNYLVKNIVNMIEIRVDGLKDEIKDSFDPDVMYALNRVKEMLK